MKYKQAYEATDIDKTTTRGIIGNIGEEVSKYIFSAIDSGSSSGADLILPNDSPLEVKTALMGQGASISIEQLKSVGTYGYYSVLYYRTLSKRRPLEIYLNEGVRGLRNEVYIDTIFLLEQPHLLDFYKNSGLSETTISSSDYKRIDLSFSRAKEVFEKTKGAKSYLKVPFVNTIDQDVNLYNLEF